MDYPTVFRRRDDYPQAMFLAQSSLVKLLLNDGFQQVGNFSGIGGGKGVVQ